MADWVDLHVHTLASDGAERPAEVVRLAAEQGLRAVAVTDHDTFGGLAEALEAGVRYGIEVVPGVELSTKWGRWIIHILGYYMDTENEALCALLRRDEAARRARNEALVRRLREGGYPITMEELHAAFPGQTMLVRPQIGEFLRRRGCVASAQEAMQKLFRRGCPYYVPREYIPMETSVRTLCAAGGVAVLAHPCKYPCGPEALPALIEDAVRAGACGIETLYSMHTPEQTAELSAAAKRLGLIETGGTDYHGSRKPEIALGTGRGNLRVPYACLAAVKRKAGRA